ncbi:hypothetical protein [Hydrocarboniclastica marina]|uniref:hypothetical protein n=1 Tax=Hydrocarboniclastica marina TaxID=2259620 RepID=UPI0010A77C79|nr:hypothetical protein [Hydrocarboniclastica marina]
MSQRSLKSGQAWVGPEHSKFEGRVAGGEVELQTRFRRSYEQVQTESTIVVLDNVDCVCWASGD